MNRNLLWLVIFFAGTLSGCAAPAYYHARASTESDGAIVRGHWTWASWRTYVDVVKVDGQEVFAFDASGPIPVDPGSRSLTVRAYHYDFQWEKVLQATLVAGHSYQVRFEETGEQMIFWLEDEASHETVSDKVSATASPKPFSLPLIFIPTVY